MKIALMLRAIDEIDGPGIATKNLIDKLIEIDRNNEYIVFFKNKKFLNRYKKYENVKEILVNVKSKIIYDQIFVPILSHKEKVDLIFNTKFTVPLFTKIRSMTIMRGSEYWIHPEFCDKIDLLYVKNVFPFYARKAIKIVTISEILKKDLNKFLKIPLDKMVTIYSAHHERFKLINDKMYLEEVRRKFLLPEKFILSVAKVHPTINSKRSKIYPGKNIHGIVESFYKAKKRLNEKVKIVFLGENINDAVKMIHSGENLDHNDFVFPGYIPQEYMPAIYNMASLLIFPSYYESFGLPLVEAMACGCPVITSNTGACPEIVGDAGIICDPHDTAIQSDNIIKILTQREKAQELRKLCLERANYFSWEKNVKTLLELFKSIAET